MELMLFWWEVDYGVIHLKFMDTVNLLTTSESDCCITWKGILKGGHLVPEFNSLLP